MLTNTNSPSYSSIFEDITWRDLDVGIVNFLKYLANFFFYRFGLEICFFMTTLTIIIRMDAYAILYGVWLGLFLRLKRETIRKIWTAYFLFLLFILPIQYIWCLGLPPLLCFGKFFIFFFQKLTFIVYYLIFCVCRVSMVFE